MKATVASFAALVASASAFMAPTPLRVTAPAAGRSGGMSMMANSKAIPFMPQPEKLDGSMPGDMGFDPLGLSSVDVDWSKVIVPPAAVMRDDDISGVDTLYWMRESELKHGRIAQLAVVGWILVDQGFRFPGSQYAAISSSVSAHDPMVAAGNMTVLLGIVFILELIGGAAVYGAANGSGRAPGDFGLDPLKLTDNADKKARYELSEVVHCRLAMFAISGILTQSVLSNGEFPYIVPY